MATSPSNQDPIQHSALSGNRLLSLEAGRFERRSLTIALPSDPHQMAHDPGLKQFVRSSGGRWGRIVVIPLTDGDSLAYGRSFAQSLIVHGAGMISVLQLTERRHADDPNATDLINTATGILVAASGAAPLADLLDGTAVLQRIQQRHRDGIAVGVTSAAASLFAIALGPPVELLGGESTLGAW